MGLENNAELALANLDLNDPVLEPVTFDDGDPLEGSSSTTIDAQILLDIEEEEEEEEDGEESSGEDTDIDDDYFMEDKYYLVLTVLPSTIYGVVSSIYPMSILYLPLAFSPIVLVTLTWHYYLDSSI